MKIDPEAVYAAVRAVPPGTVITYGDLAERAGLSRSHARSVGVVLRSRPDREAWLTTAPEDHDIPWWRVVRADGTMLAAESEDDFGRQWIAWATEVLAREGVELTADGRVASLANGPRSTSGAGAPTSARRQAREPEPCWRHETVQYSCRDCAPAR
jgi:alkylated DNA nucleotide flippase Atl1